MGVYHLMGLGLSPGAVTGSISYLAYRYQRWNSEDREFFSRSGEVAQRESGQKVGDMQSLVLFTTRDVLEGLDEMGRPISEEFSYIDNKPGYIQKKPEKNFDLPMKDLLSDLVKREWLGISGGRTTGYIFWCEVNRREIVPTYERIVKVIASLTEVGNLGKEIWINLTGGNNVINFALELAATLSGDVNRLYYLQLANQAADKCVRFTDTDEKNYWVDLPVMPLALSEINRAVLAFLEREIKADLNTLHSHLSGTHWNILQGMSPESFRKSYLEPMWQRNFIANEGDDYTIGKQWSSVQQYEQILKEAREQAKAGLTLEELEKKETWISKQKIILNT